MEDEIKLEIGYFSMGHIICWYVCNTPYYVTSELNQGLKGFGNSQDIRLDFFNLEDFSSYDFFNSITEHYFWVKH